MENLIQEKSNFMLRKHQRKYMYKIQSCIKNPVKHLGYSFFEKLVIAFLFS